MPANSEVLSRLRRTLQSIFGIGSVNVKDDSGTVQLRNEDDSAYADGALKTLRVQGDNATPAVTLTAPSGLSADVDFVLPGSDGSNGDSLVTDGAGNLSFATGGANGLDDLSDVTVGSPQDNQLLVYDSLQGQWVNETKDISVANVLKAQAFPFSQADDGTPIIAFSPPDNTIIKSVAVRIDTPAAGSGASVQVGTNSDPDAYLEISDTDLTQNIVYENFDYIVLGLSPDDIEITVTAGAQTFNGIVVIQYIETAVLGNLLNDLSDVTITSPLDGDLLVYDSLSGQWVNTEVAIDLQITNGQKMVAVDFTEADDGVPLVAFLPTDSTIIKSVSIRVDTPAAGTGASVQVGTASDTNAYMEISDSDLTSSLVYETHDYIRVGSSPEEVRVFVTAGAQTFEGTVFIQYVEKIANQQSNIVAQKTELVVSEEFYNVTLANNGDTFPTIVLPIGYDDIEIITNLKVFSGGGNVVIICNGDTVNTNYQRTLLGFDAGAATGVADNSNAVFISLPATGVFTQGTSHIYDYSVVQDHWLTFDLAYYDSNTHSYTYQIGYLPQVAITTVDVETLSGNLFSAGSSIRVIAKKKMEVVTDVDGKLGISDATYSGFAVGMIIPYMGDVPANALPCDGSSYLRDTYQSLYDKLVEANSSLVIDANNFEVPDLRDRTVFAAGSQLSVDDIGGLNEVTLSIPQLPSHNHNIFFDPTGGVGPIPSPRGAVNTSGAVATRPTSSTGNGQPHENMPPYYAVSGWCIIHSLLTIESAWSNSGNDLTYADGNVNIDNNLDVGGILNAAQINLGISPQPYLKYRVVSFDESDDGIPITVWTPEDDTLIKSILVRVNTSVSTGAATIEVGTSLDTDVYLAPGVVNMAVAGDTESLIYTDLGASPDDVEVLVSITSGSPVFSGEVIIQYYENANNAVAVGGVRPIETPQAGDLVYSGGGYNFERIPIGETGQRLAVNSNQIPEWQYSDWGGVLLDETSYVNAASIVVDLSVYDNMGFNEISFVFEDMTYNAISGAQFLLCTIAGATNGYSDYIVKSGGSNTVSGASITTSLTVSTIVNSADNNGLHWSWGRIRFLNPFDTAKYQHTQGDNVYTVPGAGANILYFGGFAVMPASTPVSTVTFVTNSGFLTTAKVKIFGHRSEA